MKIQGYINDIEKYGFTFTADEDKAEAICNHLKRNNRSFTIELQDDMSYLIREVK